MVSTNYSNEPMIELKDLYLNGIDIFHECALLFFLTGFEFYLL